MKLSQKYKKLMDILAGMKSVLGIQSKPLGRGSFSSFMIFPTGSLLGAAAKM